MKLWTLLGLCALFAASAGTYAQAAEEPRAPRTEPPKPPAPPAMTMPVAPAIKEGTWTGKVTEKGADWIRILNAEGKSERFTPRWIGGMPADGGGLDKAMLEKIQAVKVGATVTIKFVWEERYRVVTLDFTAPPPPTVSLFGSRMRGEGPFAQLIAQRFAKAHQRFGFGRLPPLDTGARRIQPWAS